MKSILIRLALPLLAGTAIATASAAGIDPVCLEGCRDQYQSCLASGHDESTCFQQLHNCLRRCTTDVPLADDNRADRPSSDFACAQPQQPIWHRQ